MATRWGNWHPRKFRGGGRAEWHRHSENQRGGPSECETEHHHAPAMPLAGTHPGGWETQVRTNTCTQMFTEALLKVAPKWKQSKCLSVDEWINETWPI